MTTRRWNYYEEILSILIFFPSWNHLSNMAWQALVLVHACIVYVISAQQEANKKIISFSLSLSLVLSFLWWSVKMSDWITRIKNGIEFTRRWKYEYYIIIMLYWMWVPEKRNWENGTGCWKPKLGKLSMKAKRLSYSTASHKHSSTRTGKCTLCLYMRSKNALNNSMTTCGLVITWIRFLFPNCECEHCFR